MKAAAAVLVALVLAGPAVAAAPAGWADGIAAARAYAAHRPGRISFAVATDAGVRGVRRYAPHHTASILKAMLLTAALQRAAHRPLGKEERHRLSFMVRRSDDVAATQVRNAMGIGTLQRRARRWGLHRFREAPIWGNSTTDAAEQARYWLRLPELLPARHRAFGMWTLEHIVARQRWGVGRVRPPGWRLAFKGGWGSGRGLVDHQVALLRRGPERVALAILVTGSGSQAVGNTSLEGIARRLLAPLRGSRPNKRSRLAS